MKDWTTIAVKNNTQEKLAEMKQVKKPGKIENYDDVIRRGMGFDEPEEKQ